MNSQITVTDNRKPDKRSDKTQIETGETEVTMQRLFVVLSVVDVLNGAVRRRRDRRKVELFETQLSTSVSTCLIFSLVQSKSLLLLLLLLLF